MMRRAHPAGRRGVMVCVTVEPDLVGADTLALDDGARIAVRRFFEDATAAADG